MPKARAAGIISRDLRKHAEERRRKIKTKGYHNKTKHDYLRSVKTMRKPANKEIDLNKLELTDSDDEDGFINKP